MSKLLRKCPKCNTYTFKKQCPKCNNDTIYPHPPVFSPDDKYVIYRGKLAYK